MQITEWIQSIGIFLAIIGLIIAILYNRKQVKMFNNQLKLNFFAEYTKRYQNIILNLPEAVNQADFEFSRLSEDDRNKTLLYMRIYFDLCSEE